MALSKEEDILNIFTKKSPGIVASTLFTRYIKQHHESHSCLERFLAKWGWDKELLVEIQKICPLVKSLKHSLLPPSFLKSCRRQLQRLKKKFEQNPERMVSSDGIWISKRSHGSQLLSDAQESIVLGFLLSHCHHGEQIS